MKKIDRSGKRYGRLVALESSERRDSKGGFFWICKCDCGKIVEIGGSNLTSGRTKSCGCLFRELSSERAKRIFTKEKTICKVADCDSDTSKGGRGYCGKHYARVKRYGDENHITTELTRREHSRTAQLKNKQAKPTTYKKYLGKHEHRVVAEKMAGRKLRSDEHVHHKDGDKHNNSPDNLIILSASEHAKLHRKETENET